MFASWEQSLQQEKVIAMDANNFTETKKIIV